MASWIDLIVYRVIMDRRAVFIILIAFLDITFKMNTLYDVNDSP